MVAVPFLFYRCLMCYGWHILLNRVSLCKKCISFYESVFNYILNTKPSKMINENEHEGVLLEDGLAIGYGFTINLTTIITPQYPLDSLSCPIETEIYLTVAAASK